MQIRIEVKKFGQSRENEAGFGVDNGFARKISGPLAEKIARIIRSFPGVARATLGELDQEGASYHDGFALFSMTADCADNLDSAALARKIGAAARASVTITPHTTAVDSSAHGGRDGASDAGVAPVVELPVSAPPDIEPGGATGSGSSGGGGVRIPSGPPGIGPGPESTAPGANGPISPGPDGGSVRLPGDSPEPGELQFGLVAPEGPTVTRGIVDRCYRAVLVRESHQHRRVIVALGRVDGATLDDAVAAALDQPSVTPTQVVMLRRCMTSS